MSTARAPRSLCFYGVNAPIDGFDTSRDAFLGAYRGNDHPQVVEKGACSNSVASGWSPIACHQIDLTPCSGSGKIADLVLGYAENPCGEWSAPGIINKKPAKEILAKYQTDAQVEQALSAILAYWEDLLSKYHVASSNEKVDRMVNIWNQYQCMVTFNMSRSASTTNRYRTRYGFTDSLSRSALVLSHHTGACQRAYLGDIAATQFIDGKYHQYQPLTKRKFRYWLWF